MYSGTQDILNILGGTRIISVGTAITAITTTETIEYFIQKADALIDAKVANLYGTSAFGTSSGGTHGVPEIIKSISADLASWYLVDAISMPNKNSYYEYGSRLFSRASDLLSQVSNGELLLNGYSKQEASMPVASDYTFDQIEYITLSGTNLVKLAWDKVIQYSEVVSGTAIDGTTNYTRDVDYKMYYYDDVVNQNIAGNIRRIGTTIADGQDVKIRYKVIKDPVFGIRDSRVWGQIDSGFTGGREKEV